MSHVLLLRARSMHPLLRLLFGLLGAALLALLLIFGAMALLVLLGVGLVALAVNRWRRPQAVPPATPNPGTHDPRVLEGDYVVVEKPTQPRR